MSQVKYFIYFYLTNIRLDLLIFHSKSHHAFLYIIVISHSYLRLLNLARINEKRKKYGWREYEVFPYNLVKNICPSLMVEREDQGLNKKICLLVKRVEKRLVTSLSSLLTWF